MLFVFVLVAGNALREVFGLLASGRLSWSLFAYLLAILIPGVIPYALPLGLLSATLLVLGRLSAQNEILALKAAGLSLWRIAAPILLLALLGSGLTLIIIFYYAPLAKTAYRTVVANAVQNDPIRFIEARAFIKDFPGFVIYVDNRSGAALQDFFIWELSEGGQVQHFVKASRGSFTYAPKENAILLTLKDGTGERRKTNDLENLQESIPLATFDELVLRLPLDRILGERKQHRKLSYLTLSELQTKYRQNRNQNPSEQSFKERIEIQTAIQKKIAFSFSVLSLCIFGIPLGIKASRSETYANLGIALALALTYFMLTIVLSWTEGTPTARPDLLLWIPNFLFQGFGFYSLWRCSKH